MEQPTYYAIIPANVRYDRQLTADEKLLYGEITCLSNAKGYCYASNAYFAELYRVDVRTVQRWLKNLLKCGYVNILYTRDSRESCLRKIYINANYVNPSPDTSGIDGETGAEPEPARAEYVEDPSVNKEYVRQIFAKWSNYGLPNRGEIEFLNRFGRCHQYLKGISSSDVLSAIDNYASIRRRSDSWYAKKHNLTFESFCKVIDKFLDGNFFAENFCDAPKESKESEQMTNPNISYKECPKCHHKTAVKMSNVRPIYYHCDNCKQDSTEEQIEDTEKLRMYGTTDETEIREKLRKESEIWEREEAERKRKEEEENAKWLKRYAEIMEARKGGATATETKDDKPKESYEEARKGGATAATATETKDDKPKESYEDYLRRLGEEALKKSESDAQAKAAEE